MSSVEEEVWHPRLTVAAMLDQSAVIERQTMRKEYTSRWFNAGSLGYCVRRQVLARGGVPGTEDSIDQKTLRNFDWGDQLHWFVRMRVKRFGVFLAEEIYLRDEDWGVSGRIDLVWGGLVQDVPDEMRANRSEKWLQYLDECRRWVRENYGDELPVEGVELKSAKSYAMERAYKEGPQTQHMFQLGFYALAADRHPEAFDEAECPLPEQYRLVMVGKDSTGLLDFGLTARWRERTLERIEELQHYWTHPDEEPPCTCGQTEGMAWEKAYCKYIHVEDLELRSSRGKKRDAIRCCDPALLEGVDRTRQSENKPQEVEQ